MAEKKAENLEGPQAQPISPSTNADIGIGGNVGGNVTVGNNNVVNYYYQQIVEKNIEKHEPDYWALKHPYPMPPNFTGRIAERAMLAHWLKEDSENRLFILRALGGFGKSALAWHWLTHDVEIKEYPKVVFWSFYEGDASFENFIEETLKYLKLEVPQGGRPQVDELLKAMGSQKILLILDGFERALRAYSSMNAAYQGDEEPKFEDNQLDCVNINAEIFLKSVCSLPNVKSKILMTTRLTPRAVKPRGEFMLGCREEALKAMHKDDAIAFFRAQGVYKGTNHEIEEVCKLYGFHPLSLRLLVGHIMTNFKNAGDIIVAQNLKASGDVIKHQNHILEVSYNGLPPYQQKLLSIIACFRSSTKFDTLESIAENKNSLEEDLHDLIERGLLQFDKNNAIFDLHPIVRRYAYERLTVPDLTAAHTQLRDYFAAIETPDKPQTLDNLAPIIELYHHTVRAGKYDEAYNMYNERLRHSLYYHFGAYELDLQLLLAIPRSINGIPYLSSSSAQTWNLLYTVMCYERTGRLKAGLSLHKPTIDLNINVGDKFHLAFAQIPFSMLSCDAGKLEIATLSIRESVEIFDETASSNWRGISHRSYGRVLMICGDFESAIEQFEIAQSVYVPEYSFHHGLSVLYFYKGLLYLWEMKHQEAYECAQQARKFSAKDSLERESIGADWLTEVSLIEIFSHETDGKRISEIDIERRLTDLLTRCRRINLVELEPDILLTRARWYYLYGNLQEALNDANEALVVAQRCEYRLKQADIHNFLAQLFLEHEKDKVKAREYAETALKLATCDGPPYYYKVAYEEAERMLEKLK